MNKLARNGRVVLSKARSKIDRQELKNKGIAYKKISSPQSELNYQKSWKIFADWGFEHGIKTISKVSKEQVEEFIKEKAEFGGRDGNGASAKTLKSYIGAINKVMYAAEKWEQSDGAKLQDMKSVSVKKDKIKNVYKDLTGKEWIEKNMQKYGNYQELIDTIQGFGLRAREVQTLNTKSFIIDKNNKMYVQTIGKGGKYRVAECTKEQNDEMVKLYGEKAIRVDDIKNNMKDENMLLRYMNNKNEALDIKGARYSGIPKHIFRSEYAQQLAKEKIQEYSVKLPKEPKFRGYAHIKQSENMKGVITQIGSLKGSVEAFREVSKNLGHNRLDVLRKYI